MKLSSLIFRGLMCTFILCSQLLVSPSLWLSLAESIEPNIEGIELKRFHSCSFIENLGQWQADVDFVAETDFGHIGLGSSSMRFNFISEREGNTICGNLLIYELLNPNDVEPYGTEQVEGTCNYYRGNDPSEWVSGAHRFQSVRYEDIWDGVDLYYDLGLASPKYEFTLDPYIDPSAISIRIEGGGELSILGRDLHITLEDSRTVIDSGLKAFYADDPDKEIEVEFILRDETTFSFEFGEYDPARSIVIDPLLQYSTYFGGSGMDYGGTSVLDSNGNVFVTGSTYSYDFPITPGVYQNSKNGMEDVVVFKLDRTLSTPLFSTYIGGSDSDLGKTILVTDSGDVIVAGETLSFDFPITDGVIDDKLDRPGYQRIYDLFLLKLNSTGTGIIFSTYIGGNGTDLAPKISMDDLGKIILAASSESANFTTTSDAYSRNISGKSDTILCVINSNGTKLLYSTFLGGSNAEGLGDIVLSDGSLVYLTGYTNSPDFPTTVGAYDTIYNTNVTDMNPYVMCVNYSTGSIVTSSYLGVGAGTSITIDPVDNIYIGGYTDSASFPTTANVFQPNKSKREDGFIAMMNPNATRLIRSSFIGGKWTDQVLDLKVDPSGCVYLTGWTGGLGFPVTRGAYCTNAMGSMDGFVSRISSNFSEMIYSTYIGGSQYDQIGSINLESTDIAIISGYTYSTTYPATSGSYSSSAIGTPDFVVSKLKCSKRYLPPEQPKNFTGIMENDSVFLEWEKPEWDGDTEILGYNISRGTVLGVETYLASTPDLSYVDSSIDNTITYYYHLTAYNRIGTSNKTESILIKELTPPDINIDLTPYEIVPGMELIFAVNATDNSKLREVCVDYSINNGISVNRSMFHEGSGNIYTFPLKLPDEEFEMEYNFLAVDIKGNNVRMTNRTVQVRGSYLPIFWDDATPTTCVPLSELRFETKVKDNWGVWKACLEYWINEGYHRNRTMFYVDVDLFYFEVNVTAKPGDTISYRFWAVDYNENWNSSEISTIDVIEEERPLVFTDRTADKGTTGEDFFFIVEVLKDPDLIDVTVRYRIGEGEDIKVKLSNTLSVIHTRSIIIPDTKENLIYSIEVLRSSGMMNLTRNRSVKIIDNDLPVLLEDRSDEAGYAGSEVNFQCEVADNIGIDRVQVEYWMLGGARKILKLEREGDYYSNTLPIIASTTGDMKYQIWVEDISGNGYRGPVCIIPISDGLPPSLSPVEDITTYIGQTVEIELVVTDNIGVDKIEWEGLPTACTGLFWKGSFEYSGIVEVNLTITDISGNSAYESFSILVLSLQHDSDKDGLPDLFEVEAGLSTVDPSDAEQDMDSDGLSNLKEFVLGTYLDIPDSDNDGMLDGWEVQYGMDPLTDTARFDTDGDGYSDLNEYLNGTDPSITNEIKGREDNSSYVILNLLLVLLIIITVIALFHQILSRRRQS